MVEESQLLDHAQRVVPRQDDRAKAKFQRRRPCRKIAERQKVIGAGRIIDVEMMFGRTADVEAEPLHLFHQPHFILNKLERTADIAGVLPDRRIDDVHEALLDLVMTAIPLRH